MTPSPGLLRSPFPRAREGRQPLREGSPTRLVALPHLDHADERRSHIHTPGTQTHTRPYIRARPPYVHAQHARDDARVLRVCGRARAQVPNAYSTSTVKRHIDLSDDSRWATLTGRPAGPDRHGGASPPGSARPPSMEVRVACPQRRPPRSTLTTGSLVTHGGLWLTRVTGIVWGGLCTNPVTPTPSEPSREERRGGSHGT